MELVELEKAKKEIREKDAEIDRQSKIAGVFCKRCEILVGGFQIPNIEFADVANHMTITNWESGMSLFGYQGLVYWPTPLEFGVALGVVALGGFLLLLGLKYLPLHLKEKAA